MPDKRSGFTIIEAILIVVVLIVVSAVGYLAYTNLYAAQTEDSSTDVPASSETTPADPVIVESTEDVDRALDELDNIPIEDEKNGKQLESATAEF